MVQSEANSAEYNTIPDTNRLVWVVSDLEVPSGHDEGEFWYKERYRSDLIEIPPGGKKRVLMKFLNAKKFLGQTTLLADPFPNGGFVNPETGEVEKHRFGKPLRIEELTSDEREEFEGMSPLQAAKRLREIEEELANANHKGDSKAKAIGKGKPQARSTRRRAYQDVQRVDGN